MLFRNLPPDVAREDLTHLMSGIARPIRLHLRPQKGHAFVQTAAGELARAVVQAVREQQPVVRGRRVFADISDRLSVRERPEAEQPAAAPAGAAGAGAEGASSRAPTAAGAPGQAANNGAGSEGDSGRSAGSRKGAFAGGLSTEDNPPSRVLLLLISNVRHPVTVPAVAGIITGSVGGPCPLRVIIFSRSSAMHALVEMPDIRSAVTVMNTLDGREMYPGCNLIRAQFSVLHSVSVKFNNLKSMDFSLPLPPGHAGFPSAFPGVPAPPGSHRLPPAPPSTRLTADAGLPSQEQQHHHRRAHSGAAGSAAGVPPFGDTAPTNPFAPGPRIHVGRFPGSPPGLPPTGRDGPSPHRVRSGTMALPEHGSSVGRAASSGRSFSTSDLAPAGHAQPALAVMQQSSAAAAEEDDHAVRWARETFAAAAGAADAPAAPAPALTRPGGSTPSGETAGSVGRVPESPAGPGAFGGEDWSSRSASGRCGSAGVAASAARALLEASAARAGAADAAAAAPSRRLSGGQQTGPGAGQTSSSHFASAGAAPTPVLLLEDVAAPRITLANIFTLCGIFGDVMRIQRIGADGSAALVEMASGSQAQLAQSLLHGQSLFGRPLSIRHTLLRQLDSAPALQRGRSPGPPGAGSAGTVVVSLPGVPSVTATVSEVGDYRQSRAHRFRTHSRGHRFIAPPSARLHLSNMPDGTREENVRGALEAAGTGPVGGVRFLDAKGHMCVAQTASAAAALGAIVRLHNSTFLGRYLRVSFAKQPSTGGGGGGGGAVRPEPTGMLASPVNVGRALGSDARAPAENASALPGSSPADGWATSPGAGLTPQRQHVPPRFTPRGRAADGAAPGRGRAGEAAGDAGSRGMAQTRSHDASVGFEWSLSGSSPGHALSLDPSAAPWTPAGAPGHGLALGGDDDAGSGAGEGQGADVSRWDERLEGQFDNTSRQARAGETGRPSADAGSADSHLDALMADGPLAASRASGDGTDSSPSSPQAQPE